MLINSDVLRNIEDKLAHIDSEKRREVLSIVNDFRSLFPDVPRKTNVVVHDVEIDANVNPIKQHP